MLRKPGGDREMVDILALVLHHDEQAVLTAVGIGAGRGRADQDPCVEYSCTASSTARSSVVHRWIPRRR